MEQKLTPGFFYGSAIATLVGLLFGLMLHAGWEQRPGGPRILFSTAAAAEPTHPGAYASAEDGPAADQVELADLDTSYATPDPLPVTRLAPQMFDVQPDVQPAAADEAERQDADDVIADDVQQSPPRDTD